MLIKNRLTTFNFFGLNYENRIYKKIFISTGILYSIKRNNYKNDECFQEVYLGDNYFVKYDGTESENTLLLPIELKYYPLKLKKMHPYLKLGVENKYYFLKEKGEKHYCNYNTVEEYNYLREEKFMFNFLIAGGVEIVHKNMSLSCEIIYNTRNYDYNLKTSYRYIFQIGGKITCSYLLF